MYGRKRVHRYLQGLRASACLILALLATLLLGILDYSIGPDLSFSVFYTVPIMLAAWYGGWRVGLAIAIVSAGVWLTADIAAGSQYSTLLIPVWNTLVRLVFFLIILRLLFIVHTKLQLEESLADTDALTELPNRRFFQEQLDRECTRLRRYPEPFTIAYFDLVRSKTRDHRC